MKKGTFVKIGVVFTVLVAVVTVGGIIAVQSIDTDQLKNMLTDQVKKSTGRVLAINGPVEIHIGFVPRVVVNDVSLSNPAGSTRPEMVKIKRFEMEVAIRPLLNKKILVNRLILSSPDVLIETEPKGPGNLDFTVSDKQEQEDKAVASAEKREGTSGFSIVFNELKIEQGKFVLYDRATKKAEEIGLELLSLRPDKKEPTLLNLQMRTTVRGHKIDLSGNLGGVDSALSGKPWPLQLKAVIAGLTLRADGTVADLKALSGLNINLTAQGSELAEVIRLAGEQAPKVPDSLGPFSISARLKDEGKQFSLSNVDLKLGKKELVEVLAQGSVKNLSGTISPDLKLQVESTDPAALAPLVGTDIPVKGPFHLNTQVKGSGSQWTLSELDLTANKSDLKGVLQVKLGKKPLLTGQFASTLINLADFSAATPSGTQQAGQAKPTKAKGDGRVFSDQPLPLSALQSVDADLKLQVAKLLLESRQLSDVQVTIGLKNGSLTVAPFHFGLAGGTFEGNVHLDGSRKTPTLTVLVNGKGVELGKLQEKGSLSGGKSDLKVDLKGSGQSVRALMASLNGETVVSVGEGKLANKAINWAGGDFLFQILGSINPFAKSEDYTKMSCAALRFVISNGVATANNGIALRTDKVDVIGSGTVNLRSERLDLGIKPRARGGVGLSLSTPLAGLIRVNGTLAKPSMGIDAVGTLKTAASLGAGVATGGLSTLGELLIDKVAADGDPCSTALGKVK
ncbi:MAG: AsmA family protein [Desulfobulbus sp.]|nr:AsmA family protein [Desulfobulbus sp.]